MIAANAPLAARPGPGGSAPRPPLANVAASEGEVDFAVQYIIINGFRAHPRQLLAKFKSGVPAESRQALLQAFDLRVQHEHSLMAGAVVLDSTKEPPPPVASPEEAKARGEEMQGRIKALMNAGHFEYVEPDYIRTIQAIPAKPAFTDGTLWGLRNTGQNGGQAGADIDAVRAWDITTGSANVIVAVVDSGIHYTHTDLAPQMWRNPGEIAGNGIDDDRDGYVDNVFGINATREPKDPAAGNPMDDNGHGTHVAGTIGATPSGGAGRQVGVAWQVRLMACKFSNSLGAGSDSAAVKCINFAVSRGARILNLSWGGGPFSHQLSEAISTARGAGILVVAAAGNDGLDNDKIVHFPSGYPHDNIIAVAAINRQDKLWHGSNHGLTSVDIGAPGADIYSTNRGSDLSYANYAGTSQAAPHVAGVAALVLARFPNITLAELRQRILGGAVRTEALRNKTSTGGRLSAYNALVGDSDGALEVVVSPEPGTMLVRGTNVTFVVRVTDTSPVANASVTGIIAGQPNVIFSNNGVAPDVSANDHLYSASMSVPVSGPALNLQIVASAPGKNPSTTSVTYPIETVASNDSFAGRVAIAGSSTTVTGSNIGASKEAGEPSHAGVTGGRSVWWSWTAPADGAVTIRTDGTAFDSVLGVYTGTALSSLVQVSSDDDSGVDLASSSSFNAIGGTTYQIAVDGVHGSSGGITLGISFTTTLVVPTNNDFAGRIAISGVGATVNGSNLGATKEIGESNHGGDAGGRSVWWSWAAPANGIVTMSTNGSLFDTTLGVYTGTTVSSLTLIASDDDGGEGSRSLVSFAAVAGTTYQIAVDGYNGAPGSIVLSVSLSVPTVAPANDRFANRAPIAGSSDTATGTNVGATKDAGEGDHAGNSGGRSVWWTWTALSSGTASVTTAGTNFDTLLAVYTGTTVDTLSLVAANNQDPAGGSTSRLTFAAVAGTVYQIAVDGASTGLSIATGSIALRVAVTVPSATSPNDAFANPTVISGLSITVTGSNIEATKEPGEPNHAGNSGGRSAWWTWTAPTSGIVTIKTDGSNFDTLLAVYTGSTLAALTTVAQDDDGGTGAASSVSFNAVGGVVYRIAVDGFAGGSGNITLSVALGTAAAAPANDNFAHRIALAGSSSTVAGANNGATKEVGEPNHAGDSGGRSVWWTWTAPQSGRVNIDTIGSSFDTLLAVYSGTAPGNLTAIASDDESGGNFTSALSLFVTAGTSYALAVDGWNGASGAIVLRLLFTETNELYFSNFESFPAGPNQLAGRGGWLSTNNTDGASGLFQGFVGSRTVWLGLNPTLDASVEVWRPIGYDPLAAGTPVLQLSVDVSIIASSNGRKDNFYFFLYNPQGQRLGGVNFDNRSLRINGYDGVNHQDVGSFANGVRYSLVATMDFATNRWSASLGGVTLFTNQPIHALGTALALGDIGAAWIITTPGSPGDNYLVFDNYRIALPATGTLPVFTLQPQSQTAVAGQTVTFTAAASGNPSPAFQWRKNGVAIPGATLATLSLPPVQSAAAGTYDVLATNAQGSVPSNPAVLSVNPPSAGPANDRFENAAMIASGGAQVAGANIGATKESGEPNHDGNPGGRSVWWQWTATASGTVTINSSGSSFDTVLAVYTGGTVNALTLVVSNDDGGGGAQSAASFAAVSGTTYRIAVDGYGGATGSITLTLIATGGSGPVNDAFTSAPALGGGAVSVTGTNAAATKETGEPDHAGGAGGRSVWWRWTAPATGTVRVNTIGSSFDTLLAVYLGTSVNGLALVAADDDSGGSATSALSFDATSGTTYWIAVDGFAGATGAITLNIATALMITSQPQNRTAATGTGVTFSVTASGMTPLSYQWSKDGTAISGATNATHAVTSVQVNHAGSYTVVVSSGANTLVSNPATLVVTAPVVPPNITTHPASQAATTGQNVTFGAVASGTAPLFYQWRKNGLNLSGATAATLTLSGVQPADAGSYTVWVGNGAGSVISNSATLTVTAPLTPPVITTQPGSQSVNAGGDATFIVVATGSPPLAYQWKKNGLDVAGASGSTLSLINVQSADAGSYAVVVGNGAGAVISVPATLAINATSGGVSANLAVVGQAVYTSAGGNLSLSATLAYAGLTPAALGYTINLPAGWSLVSTTGPNVPGTTPVPGTTGALDFAYSSFPSNQASFTVVVSYPAGLSGNQTMSASAIYRNPLQNLSVSSVVLTRAEPPVITTRPVHKSAVVGSNVTFTIAATSAASVMYQWKKNGVDIVGATGPTLTLTNVQLVDGATYAAVVSNIWGSVTSSGTVLTVVDVRATHAVSGGGYAAGGTVTITNSVTYTGTAVGLGWQTLLPGGWTYASGAGSEGDVKPAVGATELLEWAWTVTPASPVTFSYTLNVPTGTVGGKQLAALVLFRPAGDLVQLLATPDPLPVPEAVVFHDADADRNGRISLLELTRVIELFNARNGTTRTGCYKVQDGSEDGFAPEPTRASSTVVTLTRYYSADSNRDGKLSILELTRVIELFNYRTGTTRTGVYHAQAGTEDGFAPGP